MACVCNFGGKKFSIAMIRLDYSHSKFLAAATLLQYYIPILNGK